MHKKILITGVSGQDGSYMAEYCLELGHTVYGMIRRTSTPNYSNIKDILDNKSFKLVYGDLSDLSSIESIVKEIQPDYFINFGAQSYVGASWAMPEQTFDVTALGVLRCLEALRKFAPNCRFYSAGSSEEMGDVEYSPQDIKHPIKPRSPYGAAKASARHIVKVYRESYNMFALHSILYNHESERRGEEFVTRKITKGVAKIIKNIQDQKTFDPIELGNLESRRDWSHAKDFVKGVWLMLNQPYPKEYVLSSGETHSIREFVNRAFSVAGINETYWIGENENETLVLPDYLITEGNVKSKILVKINSKFYRPAEVELLLGDSEEARKDLNWKPEINFERLVEKMVQHDLRELKID